MSKIFGKKKNFASNLLPKPKWQRRKLHGKPFFFNYHHHHISKVGVYVKGIHAKWICLYDCLAEKNQIFLTQFWRKVNIKKNNFSVNHRLRLRIVALYQLQPIQLVDLPKNNKKQLTDSIFQTAGGTLSPFTGLEWFGECSNAF